MTDKTKFRIKHTGNAVSVEFPAGYSPVPNSRSYGAEIELSSVRNAELAVGLFWQVIEFFEQRGALRFGKCEECDRVLVAQMGMDVEGAGNWDGTTKRCEFCKATDYFTRVQRAQAAYDMDKHRDEVQKHLDEHPFPKGHKK